MRVLPGDDVSAGVALGLGVLIGALIAVKAVAWLLIAAGKLLMDWIHKAMIE